MATASSTVLAYVAEQTRIAIDDVEKTVVLLDEGNTVPFVTRYRRDQTGGLNEQQIVRIEEMLARFRQLADRKQTIVRTVESQQKLTPELAAEIESCTSLKSLEDIYLPYKPKKQSLAAQARQKGLEPLAQTILTADSAINLEESFAQVIDPEKGLATSDEVMTGVRHLLAEHFSNQSDLRVELRKIIWRTAELVSQRAPVQIGETSTTDLESSETVPGTEVSARSSDPSSEHSPAVTSASDGTEPRGTDETAGDDVPLIKSAEDNDIGTKNSEAPESGAVVAESPPSTEAEPTVELHATVADTAAPNDEPCADDGVASADTSPTESGSIKTMEPESLTKTGEPDVPVAKPILVDRAALRRKQRREAKARKRKKLEQSVKDYFDYRKPIAKIPHYRVLALNRGERGSILGVKIQFDQQAIYQKSELMLVNPAHPHADILRDSLRDSLSRLTLPSLEREIRLDLTERAEKHALSVFTENLRKLLLQPPLPRQRVLAVDPGLRNGCRLVALDECGDILEHGTIHLIGSEGRQAEGRKLLVDMIKKHKATILAIGNGTACGTAEQLVAEVIESDFQDQELSYLIVNEAGASVYSISAVGREDLPELDPSIRGAVSIGRRSLDPLSELVKINPSSIGVGLYQHDVKSSPLRASLDAVVSLCVNFVGVDLNTASPSLLRYVSGLNQLTARRICEYRKEHGPFQSREQLNDVPGIGDITFLQSAGFLKVSGGDNPLDATWIHPESYDIARRVLQVLETTPSDASPYSPSSTDDSQAIGPATQQQPSDDSASIDPQPTTNVSKNGLAPSPSVVIPDDLVRRMANINVDELASQLSVGPLLLKDILAALTHPGRDPRQDFPPRKCRRKIVKLEDIEPGMELTATVLNVVDFGAFVDIGISDSGLIHVSRLADRYITDPHEVVSVGDALTVWVVDIDHKRRRVSLTAVKPGTERPGKRHDKTRGEQKRRDTSVPQKSRRGKRPDSRSHTKKGNRSNRFVKRPKPKPVAPITEAMAEGREPMRTFSDLKQFFEKQPSDDSADVNKEKGTDKKD